MFCIDLDNYANKDNKLKYHYTQFITNKEESENKMQKQKQLFWAKHTGAGKSVLAAIFLTSTMFSCLDAEWINTGLRYN